MAVANQLALPGLGTVMAGRKIGYLQLAFSMCGVVLTTTFLIWCVPNLGDWIPTPEDEEVILATWDKWKMWLLVAGLGFTTFLIGWCMALFSSQSIVREQSEGKPKK